MTNRELDPDAVIWDTKRVKELLKRDGYVELQSSGIYVKKEAMKQHGS